MFLNFIKNVLEHSREVADISSLQRDCLVFQTTRKHAVKPARRRVKSVGFGEQEPRFYNYDEEDEEIDPSETLEGSASEFMGRMMESLRKTPPTVVCLVLLSHPSDSSSDQHPLHLFPSLLQFLLEPGRYHNLSDTLRYQNCVRYSILDTCV